MGKLFVVGIGPGGPDGMTIAARRALEAADIVVGYTKYVELALTAVPDAAHLATPMMHEVDGAAWRFRARRAEKPWRRVQRYAGRVPAWASPVLGACGDYPM